MTTHATGPLSGLTWLKRGINLGRHNARAVFGAAAILMFLWLVPSVVQLMLMAALRPGPMGASIIGVLTTLLAIGLLPPLVGGYLRLIDASESGQPATASDIFAPFRHGGDARRLISFGAIMLVSSLVLFAVLLEFFGEGIAEWVTQIMTLSQQSNGQLDPSQVPAAPEGLGRLIGLGSIAFLLFGSVWAIGFGQVALGGQRVRTAIADGVMGTLKNLLPLLFVAIVVALAFLPLGLILGLVFKVLEVGGSLIHPVLGSALLLVANLAFMVAMYVVMFGVMYYLWRDVCAPADTQGNGPSPPSSSNNHQIEL